MIIAAAEPSTRIALWGVNQALHDRLNSFYYHTFAMRCGVFTTAYPESEIIPPIGLNLVDRAFPHLGFNLERYCRIFDIDAHCEMELAKELFACARNAAVLRVSGPMDTATFTPLPSTVVIKTTCSPTQPADWEALYSFTFHAIPDGPKRVVINCEYIWADLLFACDVGFKALPSSVTEFVIHFKHVDNGVKRPRYAICEGDHNIHDAHTVVAVRSMSDPLPYVTEDQHLDVITVPVPCGGISVVDRIAKVYAKTIGKGKQKRPRNLKLTIVGLDEFDEARDADAAEDEHFAASINDLPWGETGPPPKSYYKRPKYSPVAPKFIDEVAKAVHKTKRNAVKTNVRVLSRAQYLAELGPRGRKEEDWWRRKGSDGC